MLGLVAITYICMIWFAICTIPFAKACLCKCVQGSCREWTDACKEYFGCKKKEPTMAEKVGLGGGKKPGSGKVRTWEGGVYTSPGPGGGGFLVVGGWCWGWGSSWRGWPQPRSALRPPHRRAPPPF